MIQAGYIEEMPTIEEINTGGLASGGFADEQPADTFPDDRLSSDEVEECYQSWLRDQERVANVA